MTASLLKKLAGVTAVAFLLLWAVYIYREVPHEQTPYLQSVGKATGLCLLQHGAGVQLNKSGADWVVHRVTGPELGGVNAARSSWPAESSLVKTLLDGLSGLQLEDVISDRADRQADFEVDADSGMRVTLLAPSKILADGVFGKQASDFNHLYFRFADKPEIYLARGMIHGDLGKADVHFWRSRQVIAIPEMQIQGIEIEGKGFKTDLVRTSTEVWMMNGKPVDPAPVDALVGRLAHLRADDFMDAQALPGLSYDGLTFARIRVKGTATLADLRIGTQAAKTRRYPASMGQDSGLFWLSESSVLALLQKPAAFKAKK